MKKRIFLNIRIKKLYVTNVKSFYLRFRVQILPLFFTRFHLSTLFEQFSFKQSVIFLRFAYYSILNDIIYYISRVVSSFIRTIMMIAHDRAIIVHVMPGEMRFRGNSRIRVYFDPLRDSWHSISTAKSNYASRVVAAKSKN